MANHVDLKAIVKALYARRHAGIVVPYEPCATSGWTPSEGECHLNSVRYAQENRGGKFVRGWLVYDFTLGPLIGRPSCYRFNAHTVLEDANGRLFDITPSRASQAYPFIRHEGPADEFEALLGAGVMYLDYPL